MTLDLNKLTPLTVLTLVTFIFAILGSGIALIYSFKLDLLFQLKENSFTLILLAPAISFPTFLVAFAMYSYMIENIWDNKEDKENLKLTVKILTASLSTIMILYTPIICKYYPFFAFYISHMTFSKIEQPKSFTDAVEIIVKVLGVLITGTVVFGYLIKRKKSKVKPLKEEAVGES